MKKKHEAVVDTPPPSSSLDTPTSSSQDAPLPAPPPPSLELLDAGSPAKALPEPESLDTNPLATIPPQPNPLYKNLGIIARECKGHTISDEKITIDAHVRRADSVKGERQKTETASSKNTANSLMAFIFLSRFSFSSTFNITFV
ncbi:unnamed protein product [Trifolium pratense]|uniref:Uncharacterized protein n=1 Tax=Trifolium pratense TaxID=57577 RepID=A0ACB0JVC6_TRIPR|nr:unnamed protein product [Trifolium pratense]